METVLTMGIMEDVSIIPQPAGGGDFILSITIFCILYVTASFRFYSVKF